MKIRPKLLKTQTQDVNCLQYNCQPIRPELKELTEIITVSGHVDQLT